MTCPACGTENAVTARILADDGRWLTETGRDDDGAELLAEARALVERMGSTAV